MSEGSLNEKSLCYQLFSELTSKHNDVNRKVIVRGVIEKLDTEKDASKVEIYRQILEMLHQPQLEE
jgi:hypothetical protein